MATDPKGELISARNLAIVEARDREELTYRQIAAKLGISSKRAHQIYKRSKDILTRATQDGESVPKSRLSVRARNCLANAGLGNAMRWQVRLWLDSPTSHPLMVKNLGRRTLTEIDRWARSTGNRK